MAIWEAWVVRVWHEPQGIRGRVVDVANGRSMSFSSAAEAGDIVLRMIQLRLDGSDDERADDEPPRTGDAR